MSLSVKIAQRFNAGFAISTKDKSRQGRQKFVTEVLSSLTGPARIFWRFPSFKKLGYFRNRLGNCCHRSRVELDCAQGGVRYNGQ